MVQVAISVEVEYGRQVPDHDIQLGVFLKKLFVA